MTPTRTSTPFVVLCAPGAYKECMSAPDAADAMARGARRAAAIHGVDIIVHERPMSDGGADFVESMLAGRGATIGARVPGPLGDPVDARFGIDADRAFVQLSAAAGMHLVARDRRDPTRTTTFGVGRLILAAIDRGATDITIGVGNSATVDGGAGALAALGVRFFDERDAPIERPVGGDLVRVARVDPSGLDPRLARTRITVACDVDNPLLGPDGAAPTFGPQKGATPAQVALLERGLASFVQRLRDAGFDPRPDEPHTGAAGGFGFGLNAALGATLAPTVGLMLGPCVFDRSPAIELVLTGEGRLDGQTVRGKLPIALARAARAAGLPTVALVGSVGEGAALCLDPTRALRAGGATEGGLADYAVITPPGMDLDEALRRGPALLEAEAERVVGEWIGRRSSFQG